MFIEKRMFGYVDSSATSFLSSGWLSSAGPAYTSFVQFVDAPSYPSKSEPTEKPRLSSMPQALRDAGSNDVDATSPRGAAGLFGPQKRVIVRRWPDAPPCSIE